MIVSEYTLSKSTVINYQPGNGTKYDLLIVTVQAGDSSRFLGLASNNGWIIVHLNSQDSTPWIVPSYQGTISAQDVQRKMNESEGDAIALAKFLSEYLGITLME